MRKLMKITAVIVLVAIMLTYIQTLVFAAESELTRKFDTCEISKHTLSIGNA